MSTPTRDPERLVNAVAAFLKRFDELMPYANDIIRMQQTRSNDLVWTYGNWKQELDALRAALDAAKEET